MSDIFAGTFHTITSRKAFKKAIKMGLVKLNDTKAYTSDFVAEGDVITI
jgi:RNA-binding protein YlmH